MERTRAAGLCKEQIAQLIQDQEVQSQDQIGGAALTLCTRLGAQFVYKVEDVEEPAPLPISVAGMADVFARGDKTEAEVKALHAKVGRLAVENDVFSDGSKR